MKWNIKLQQNEKNDRSVMISESEMYKTLAAGDRTENHGYLCLIMSHWNKKELGGHAWEVLCQNVIHAHFWKWMNEIFEIQQ